MINHGSNRTVSYTHLADSGTKEKALKQATKEIDRQLLRGRKTNPEQELAFPRHPDTEIPAAVKEACCEEALAILERGKDVYKRQVVIKDGSVSRGADINKPCVTANGVDIIVTLKRVTAGGVDGTPGFQGAVCCLSLIHI